MPYAAAVSLCSQGCNRPHFWTTTAPAGCHITQYHHPAREPLLIGGDGGADDERQCQPTMNVRDNSGMMNRGTGTNSGDNNVGTTMNAGTTTQGQRAPGNERGQQQRGDNDDAGTTTTGGQRTAGGGTDAPVSTRTA
jgi:hypothetical protein